MAERPSTREQLADTAHLGGNLRDAREEAGVSLREMARRLGISASALSQIETGKSRPSVRTLYAIVSELGLSMDTLLSEARLGAEIAPAEVEIGPPRNESRPSVRRALSRRALELECGVSWDRLTADDPNVDFLLCTYPPGSSSNRAELPISHEGYEYGVVLSGELELTVGAERFVLGPRDACSFDSRAPHRLANPGDVPATAVWTVVRRQSEG